MYEFELNGIMFLLKMLKYPARNFDIQRFVSFGAGGTRSSVAAKMVQKHSNANCSKHLYFNRIPRL